MRREMNSLQVTVQGLSTGSGGSVSSGSWVVVTDGVWDVTTVVTIGVVITGGTNEVTFGVVIKSVVNIGLEVVISGMEDTETADVVVVGAIWGAVCDVDELVELVEGSASCVQAQINAATTSKNKRNNKG